MTGPHSGPYTGTTYIPDPDKPVKCVICIRGETRPGQATVTLQRGDCTIIIKEVPAEVCQNCGE